MLLFTGSLCLTLFLWCRHHNSIELRLETVERHLKRLSGRVGRLENDEHGDSSVVTLPDSTPSQRITDTLIEEDEPQSLVGSVDATDGVGTIRFSDEENAGFFGNPHRPVYPNLPQDRPCCCGF